MDSSAWYLFTIQTDKLVMFMVVSSRQWQPNLAWALQLYKVKTFKLLSLYEKLKCLAEIRASTLFHF